MLDDTLDEYARLEQVKKWYETDRNRIFIISGYAGCGKTTLARKIPEYLNLTSYAFLAPTGKAATVLGNAQTIHSYLYNAIKDQDTSQLEFIRKEPHFFIERLLIVDEISMVNEELLADLRSTNIPIIGLGDSAQLPPINGNSTILEKPDIFLTKVYRNDGGLLTLATDIRSNKQLKKQYENVSFRSNILLDIDEIDAGSIVICRYNKTRRIMNLILRSYLYSFTKLIEIGEKLIILRNDRELGLSNGSIVTVIGLGVYNKYMNTQVLTVLDNENRAITFTANLKTLTNQDDKTNWKTTKTLDVDYAYCITCHKSQGSEFKKVFVIKQGIAFDDWEKWYYTAVTRARQKLYIYPDMDNILSECLGGNMDV